MAKGTKYSQQFKEDAVQYRLISSGAATSQSCGESWSQRICTEKLDESSKGT